MTRRISVVAIPLAAALLCAPALRAADHLDGPAASADPSADITDLFAWTSSDGKSVNLVMDVFPLATSAAKFSNTVQYVFHTQSRSAYGKAAGGSVDVICTFDTAQNVSCWAGNEYLTGNANTAAGITSASGKLRVFAGLRDDPFFFNLDGFKDVVATTKAVKGSLTLDAAGCPDLTQKPSGSSQTYQQILFNKLTHTPVTSGGTTTSGPAQDHFKGLNVLAVVVQIDKTLLTAGGPILSVWAATHRSP